MARYDRTYGMRGGYRDYDWYEGPRPGYRDRDWMEGLGRSGERGYRRGRGNRPAPEGYRSAYQDRPGEPPRPYDRDYWWLGEHELRRRGALNRYDEAYARFDREWHPRYSPVGGTYGAMGGSYAYRRPPRPLRDDTWFSDWTRWF